MRVHLETLGCRLNEAELERWSRDFTASGCRITTDPADADLVVVNTCAVTQEAVRKSRKLVRRAQRANPHAKLVVSGCYASLDPLETEQALGVDLVIGNQMKDRLVEITRQKLDLHVMPEIATEPGENPLLARGRQRAFVKVQDGCRYRCTYCIITVARGDERSRPMDAIVDEINLLHAEGIQEVVLTGVHLGGYGSDRNSDLTTLITGVLERTAIPRLRLGSVEPWDLPDDFWRLFETPRFMPHLHLPLQSGSDTVLRRMARRCKTAEFARLVAEARRSIPGFNVTTDIIVGFPGETPSEWQESLAFVERVGFGHLHIFAYSPRAGTRAAVMPDQVDPDTKKQRSHEMHALGARLKRETLERFAGSTCEVLIEGKENGKQGAAGCWFGYTPHFLPVAIQADDTAALENRIMRVRLGQPNAEGNQLTGRLSDD